MCVWSDDENCNFYYRFDLCRYTQRNFIPSLHSKIRKLIPRFVLWVLKRSEKIEKDKRKLGFINWNEEITNPEVRCYIFQFALVRKFHGLRIVTT